jgi:hypothetical protein
MNFYGAKFEEIVGVMNHIAREALDPASWQIVRGQLVTQGLVAGVNLRLRHVYNDNGLCHLSLTGNRWNVSFKVNRLRPRSMPDDEISQYADIVFAPPEIIQLISKTYAKRLVVSRISRSVVSRASRSVMEPPVNHECLHSFHIMSPEEFRTEMTILRMFASEWEQ